MASPHVAGAAALAAAVRPASSGAEIKGALLAGVDRLPGMAGASVSGGRLNAAAAAHIAAGQSPAPAPDPGPLTTDLPELGQATTEPPAPVEAPSPATPRISRLRVSGQPRVCRGRRGCQSRTATLSFAIAAAADVQVRLQRRRCVRTHCRWRAPRTRTRHVPAGRTRWVLGPPPARHGAAPRTLARDTCHERQPPRARLSRSIADHLEAAHKDCAGECQPIPREGRGDVRQPARHD